MGKWVCSNCAFSYIEQKSGFKVLRCALNLDQVQVNEKKRCDKRLSHKYKR